MTRHKWSKTGSDTNAHFFKCAKCGLYRKQYTRFNMRVLSFSRDGVVYTIVGDGVPFPVCNAPGK